jgi:hypothetical protein
VHSQPGTGEYGEKTAPDDVPDGAQRTTSVEDDGTITTGGIDGA